MKGKRKRRRHVSDTTLDNEWNESFGKVYPLPYFSTYDEQLCCLSGEYKELRSFLKEHKEKLNSKKSELNNIDITVWHKHTSRLHKCGLIPYFLKKTVKAELATQAWAKFYTILNTFPEVVCKGNFTTFHLCEAPGAFVSSLNHYIENNSLSEDVRWTWTATTLNPYYEGNQIGRMLTDDRLISLTLENWDFMDDFTGDIMSAHAFDYFTTNYGGKFIMLITADGSIDCSQSPGQQEMMVLPLFLWETAIALSLLHHGGSFILKIFTVFEEKTIALLFLLWRCFDELYLIKPGPSKPGNSEVYIVALGFCRDRCHGDEVFTSLIKSAKSDNIDINEDFFESLPSTFSRFLQTYVSASCRKQIEAIGSNLHYYFLKQLPTNIDEVRKYIANRFLADFNIFEISNYLTPYSQTGLVYFSFVEDQNYKVGSFNQRSLCQNDISLCYSSMERLNKQELSAQHNLQLAKPNFKITLGKKIREIFHSLLCPFIELKKFYEVCENIKFPPARLVFDNRKDIGETVVCICSPSLKYTVKKIFGDCVFDHEISPEFTPRNDFCNATNVRDTCNGDANRNETHHSGDSSQNIEDNDKTVCRNTCNDTTNILARDYHALPVDNQRGECLVLFISIRDGENNKNNVNLLLRFLKRVPDHKCWLIVFDSIILSNFIASLVHFVACIFRRVTYTLTPENSISMTFHEFSHNAAQLDESINDIELLASSYSKIGADADILLTLPINEFMHSELRKYLRQQNRAIVSALHCK